MNRLFAFYLLASGVALVGPHRPAAWPVLALLHVALAALALMSARAGATVADSASDVADGAVAARTPSTRGSRNSVTTWLAAFYPLLVMPLLYAELPLLNQSLYGGRYFDALILDWERALFGFQPARELARGWASAWVSEPLHAAYVSYYLIIYAPPLLVGWRRGTRALREAVFALALVFFVHYLFFVYFPVEGPRYRFDSPVPDDAQGAVYGIAHALLEAGSSRGAAFPSSHVGVSVVATMITWRMLRPLAPVVALLTVGLAIGAVYGGFHYGIDALAGAALGAVLGAFAPRLRQALEPGLRSARAPRLRVDAATEPDA